MIYVDQPIHSWRNKKWCHLVSDNLDELHEFAAKLGLKPHYDITAAKREQAIKLGAIAIKTKQMAERVKNILRERRKNSVSP